MKKNSLIIAGLIALVLLGVVWKTRKESQQVSPVPQVSPVEVPNGPAQAIDAYLAQNPSDAAAPPLRRLSAAMKANPSVQETVLGEAVVRSLHDGAVSTQEAAMLNEAAALAEQDHMTDAQLQQFSAKFPEPVSSESTATDLDGVSAIDHYIQTNPSGRGVPQLHRLLAAEKKRPAQTQLLTRAAAQSVQDGVVSPQEAVMLQEAATLSERNPIPDKELKAFSSKYQPAQKAERVPGSPAPASVVIETYIQKHPSGRGVPQLRRLSKAMKTRPDQGGMIAETAAHRIEDGSISKEDVVMLEEAAALTEQEGLSPREMAEFSRKYAQGIGLTEKPQSAPMPKRAPSKALPRFEGKRQLTYTFTGLVQCAKKPCKDIRVSVRISCGQWMETREGGLDPKGQYLLQMPVLSAVNEKVAWQLEAHSSDLHKSELNGARVTTDADRDINVQNNFKLEN